MSVSAANVAEVEYYQALISDQFKKLEALHKHQQQQLEIAAAGAGVGRPRPLLVGGSSGEETFESRWAKCLQRLHKSIDQLRNECEKLAITGMTAESAASLLERQKRRFGFPSSTFSQPKTKSNPKQVAGEEAFTVSTRDPALAAAEKWRWIAYEHEIDAVFANKYPGERVTTLMWESSPVAQTLKSRMKTLLTELIPLERVLDNGKIRRTHPHSAESVGVGGSGPATALCEDCDHAIVRLLMGSVRDALEQLRSSCRDAVTIKEASVVEARLKATTAVAAALGSLSATHMGASTSVSALSTPTFHVRAGSSSYATTSASVGGAVVSPLLTPSTATSQAPSPPPLPSPSISLPPVVGNTHFHNVHSSAALTPFEVSVVQFMAAEVVRIATCYGVTLDGGNACSGTSALAASRAERSERERERDHRLALLVGAGGCHSYTAENTCRPPTTAIGTSSSSSPRFGGAVGESAEKGAENAKDGADLRQPCCTFDHGGGGGEKSEKCATQDETPRSSSSVDTAPAIFASAGLSDGGEGVHVHHDPKDEVSVAPIPTEPVPPVTSDSCGTAIVPSSGVALGAKACVLM